MGHGLYMVTHDDGGDLRQVLGRTEGACEEATAQGAVSHDAYAQLPECGNDLLLHVHGLAETFIKDTSAGHQ